MNRKMTRFAFGVWCGVFGASGLAARASLSRPARASEPKPQAALFRAWRRVMGSGNMGYCLGRMLSATPWRTSATESRTTRSIHIPEVNAREQRLIQPLPRGLTLVRFRLAVDV